MESINYFVIRSQAKKEAFIGALGVGLEPSLRRVRILVLVGRELRVWGARVVEGGVAIFGSVKRIGFLELGVGLEHWKGRLREISS